jgi:hypothetical protein
MSNISVDDKVNSSCPRGVGQITIMAAYKYETVQIQKPAPSRWCWEMMPDLYVVGTLPIRLLGSLQLAGLGDHPFFYCLPIESWNNRKSRFVGLRSPQYYWEVVRSYSLNYSSFTSPRHNLLFSTTSQQPSSSWQPFLQQQFFSGLQ